VPARSFGLVGASAGVGWDQDRDAVGGDLVDLFEVPVAGIGDDDVGVVGDAGGRELPTSSAKLGLHTSAGGNLRVLAVLAWLRAHDGGA
jgi:hypothetical protein